MWREAGQAPLSDRRGEQPCAGLEVAWVPHRRSGLLGASGDVELSEACPWLWASGRVLVWARGGDAGRGTFFSDGAGVVGTHR